MARAARTELITANQAPNCDIREWGPPCKASRPYTVAEMARHSGVRARSISKIRETHSAAAGQSIRPFYTGASAEVTDVRDPVCESDPNNLDQMNEQRASAIDLTEETEHPAVSNRSLNVPAALARNSRQHPSPRGFVLPTRNSIQTEKHTAHRRRLSTSSSCLIGCVIDQAAPRESSSKSWRKPRIKRLGSVRGAC